MIALQSGCLLFQLASGESVPCSVEMISVELTGNAEGLLDPEVLSHAAASVFHYFKNELERETVTIGEFAGALEKVLRQLGFVFRAGALESRSREIVETDLCLFARESADSLELFFFPRLRDIDEVAYVRFASVYRRFQEATDFVHEVKKLEAKQ